MARLTEEERARKFIWKPDDFEFVEAVREGGPGDPGSGHHGHKGIPGHHGGSAMSGWAVGGLTKQLITSGGFTRQPVSGDEPTDGFMVSPYADREWIADADDVDADSLIVFCEKNKDLLTQDDHYLGGWADDGKVYIDISIRAPTVEAGIEIAQRHNQLAIWNLEKMEEIRVKATREVDGAWPPKGQVITIVP